MAVLWQVALALAALTLLLGLIARFIVPGFGQAFIAPSTYVDLTQMFLLWTIALILVQFARKPQGEAEEEQPKPTAAQAPQQTPPAQ